MEHRVASREEWLQARIALLEREKAHTRERDAIRRQRRELPWMPIEKECVFDAPQGKVAQAVRRPQPALRRKLQLFVGRSRGARDPAPDPPAYLLSGYRVSKQFGIGATRRRDAPRR